MTYDSETYPSWQRADEYIVDSERVYVGRCEGGVPRVYLEESGTLYPLRKLTRPESMREMWQAENMACRLALTILFDATWGDVNLSRTLCHKFTLEVVAELPESGWRLRRDFVWAWIRLKLS
ncbi:MAG: hypothetical protein GX162_10455 [Firmicutes bacterium]|jgi:hypothetical protein|nr:hypothetical protein [Bacillota bacterium]